MCKLLRAWLCNLNNVPLAQRCNFWRFFLAGTVTGENNLCISHPTLSEKGLSLACTDVCNQAKAPYVCDVNISPAEKHLFITLLKVLQRQRWRAVGSKRNLLGWQDGQARPHHTFTRQRPPPRVPARSFSLGLERLLGSQMKVPSPLPGLGPHTPLLTPKIPCLLLQGHPIGNEIYLQNLPLHSCFCKLFYIRLQRNKGAGGQILQGQNAQKGWIFQPRWDETCRCKYKTNHVMPVICVALFHSLCSFVAHPSLVSCSPSPDTPVLYHPILGSLWLFKFYLKSTLPPLLYRLTPFFYYSN